MNSKDIEPHVKQNIIFRSAKTEASKNTMPFWKFLLFWCGFPIISLTEGIEIYCCRFHSDNVLLHKNILNIIYNALGPLLLNEILLNSGQIHSKGIRPQGSRLLSYSPDSDDEYIQELPEIEKSDPDSDISEKSTSMSENV